MQICERHGAGTENGKEYAMIGIAKWFHNWPHIRFSFIPIENSMFDISNKNGYLTTIIFFAVFLLFLCLILLLIYIIFLFLVRIRNPIKGKDINKSDQKDLNLYETLANKKEIPLQSESRIFF